MSNNFQYLVTGKNGLIGSAFVRFFKKSQTSFMAISKNDLNLLNYKETKSFIKDHNFETIINCAAMVGGIKANSSRPYDFLSNNTRIQNNIMDASIKSSVKNIVLLNSNCSYPSDATQPFKESEFLNGEPHKSNLGYALAKRSAFLQSVPLLEQYKIKTFHPIPCSLYGPNDNFNLENSHFIAAVIRKLITAKENNANEIRFWGSGNPRREFMYVDDAVEGIKFILDKNYSQKLINICWGKDHKLLDVINICSEYIGFKGLINWDKNKPDGMMRKLQSAEIINKIGWSPKVSLKEGLYQTIDWFLENKNKLRL